MEKLLKELIKGSQWEGLVYLVGGCVRDELLGEEPKDIDVMVDAPSGGILFCQWLKKEYPDITKGIVVYQRFGTAKIQVMVGGKWEDLECVMPRSEVYYEGSRKPKETSYATLYEDALRRDFCINALYKRISDGQIIDPLGRGVMDLKARQLTCPSHPHLTFSEDPLRAFRAIRFMAQKGLIPDPAIIDAISKLPPERLQAVSIERITVEFKKIITSPRAVLGVTWLVQTGLMSYISQEFLDAMEYNQNSKYHDLTLGMHCLKVLGNIQETSLELRVAALFHDIGKPECAALKEDGTTSYHGHDKTSSELTRVILERLKFSGTEISTITKLIGWHMRLKQFTVPGVENSWTGGNGQVRKIVRTFGDLLEPALSLIEADNISHKAEYCIIGQVKEFKKAMEGLTITTPKVLSCPINGNDVMKALSIPPGVKVRECLEHAQDLYDENPSLTATDLINALKNERDCFVGPIKIG